MPSDKLKLSYSRRQFLTFFADQSRAARGKQEGRAAYRLEDLAALDSEHLRQIVPVVPAGAKIDCIDDAAYLQFGEDPWIYLFVVESLSAEIFNLFNGYTSIESAAKQLARSHDLGPEQAFHEVRKAFLYLVSRRACIPSPDATPF